MAYREPDVCGFFYVIPGEQVHDALYAPVAVEYRFERHSVCAAGVIAFRFQGAFEIVSSTGYPQG